MFPAQAYLAMVNFNPRSREGSDIYTFNNITIYPNFNPRSREGSDLLKRRRRQEDPISIHAPAKGATALSQIFALYPMISIHAPAKGATRSSSSVFADCKDFNPRSREGSDEYYNLYGGRGSDFNPRSREGSDISPQLNTATRLDDFNPRSREGSDHVRCGLQPASGKFQSTLPRRERRRHFL